MRYDSP
jgi:hypothetical protein